MFRRSHSMSLPIVIGRPNRFCPRLGAFQGDKSILLLAAFDACPPQYHTRLELMCGALVPCREIAVPYIQLRKSRIVWSPMGSGQRESHVNRKILYGEHMLHSFPLEAPSVFIRARLPGGKSCGRYFCQAPFCEGPQDWCKFCVLSRFRNCTSHYLPVVGFGVS